MAALPGKLKKARKAKGWSRAETARRLGFARSAITEYEEGTRPPGIDRLPEISRVLEIPLAELLSCVMGVSVAEIRA